MDSAFTRLTYRMQHQQNNQQQSTMMQADEPQQIMRRPASATTLLNNPGQNDMNNNNQQHGNVTADIMVTAQQAAILKQAGMVIPPSAVQQQQQQVAAAPQQQQAELTGCATGAMKKGAGKQKGPRIFECDIFGCKAVFTTNFSLKRHYNKHYSKKDLRCRFCTKSFCLPQYKEEHEYTHTGEKPFPCTMCSMQFRQRGKLSHHRRVCPNRPEVLNQQSPQEQRRNYYQEHANLPSMTMHHLYNNVTSMTASYMLNAAQQQQHQQQQQVQRQMVSESNDGQQQFAQQSNQLQAAAAKNNNINQGAVQQREAEQQQIQTHMAMSAQADDSQRTRQQQHPQVSESLYERAAHYQVSATSAQTMGQFLTRHPSPLDSRRVSRAQQQHQHIPASQMMPNTSTSSYQQHAQNQQNLQGMFDQHQQHMIENKNQQQQQSAFLSQQRGSNQQTLQQQSSANAVAANMLTNRGNSNQMSQPSGTQQVNGETQQSPQKVQVRDNNNNNNNSVNYLYLK